MKRAEYLLEFFHPTREVTITMDFINNIVVINRNVSDHMINLFNT